MAEPTNVLQSALRDTVTAASNLMKTTEQMTGLERDAEQSDRLKVAQASRSMMGDTDPEG